MVGSGLELHVPTLQTTHITVHSLAAGMVGMPPWHGPQRWSFVDCHGVHCQWIDGCSTARMEQTKRTREDEHQKAARLLLLLFQGRSTGPAVFCQEPQAKSCWEQRPVGRATADHPQKAPPTPPHMGGVPNVPNKSRGLGHKSQTKETSKKANGTPLQPNKFILQ